ncbi:hypothetical protein RJT34_13664 [Clitoria ternatea]|uniref:DUF3700 domain-containing protein n=1 Tax=Clitoria ternatea TaxID=43366 RepID=A0AAN9JPD1_CLITE
MLAVFAKATGKPPEELRLPALGSNNSKTPEEIVEKFQFLWPDSTLHNFPHGNFMALSHDREGSVELKCGMTRNGSLACYDDPTITMEGCGKASASFPAGYFRFSNFSSS